MGIDTSLALALIGFVLIFVIQIVCIYLIRKSINELEKLKNYSEDAAAAIKYLYWGLSFATVLMLTTVIAAIYVIASNGKDGSTPFIVWSIVSMICLVGTVLIYSGTYNVLGQLLFGETLIAARKNIEYVVYLNTFLMFSIVLGIIVTSMIDEDEEVDYGKAGIWKPNNYQKTASIRKQQVSMKKTPLPSYRPQEEISGSVVHVPLQSMQQAETISQLAEPQVINEADLSLRRTFSVPRSQRSTPGSIRSRRQAQASQETYSEPAIPDFSAQTQSYEPATPQESVFASGLPDLSKYKNASEMNVEELTSALDDISRSFERSRTTPRSRNVVQI